MYYNELDAEEKKVVRTTEPIEKLKLRIQELIHVSQEQAFTDYLQQMQQQTLQAEARIQYLSADLEKQYRVYQENMQRRVATNAPIQEQTAVQVQQEQAPPQLQQPQMPPTQPQMPPQRGHQAPLQRPKKNMEFAVGTAVVGIVGSAFILTAMVLLGMYFMEGMMKGLLLYAGCLLVIGLSELLLYKRFPRLGALLSAMGAAGLYVSTIVNSLALGNFNEWVAMGVTVGITLFVILISRKRDAVFYRILGMVAMYCCLFLALWEKNATDGILPIQWLTLAGILFFINVMCLAVPVKKARAVMDIVHLSLNTLFAAVIYSALIDQRVKWPDSFGNIWQYLVFIAVSILVMQIIFTVQVRYRYRQTAEQATAVSLERNLGICIAYGVSAVFYDLVLIGQIAGYELGGTAEGLQGWSYRLVLAGAVAVLGLIPMLFLPKNQEKWFSWYFLIFTILGIYLFRTEDCQGLVWGLLALIAACKVVSLSKAKLPRGGDAVVTSWACAVCVIFTESQELRVSAPLFIGILISVLFLHYWTTYFEIIWSYTVAWYISWHMLEQLKLPVFVGILFLSMLIFNNIKRWHGKYIVIFHLSALAGQAVCFLLLVNPVYQNAYLTYLCMLIFGLATIVVCFQKAYDLEFPGKELVVAVFLTYMALVVRTDFSIVNSILLMCIALGCVGAGFGIRKKSIRIYGIVLSLCTCLKLVVVDFAGSNMLQKTIVFFVVGMIALIIASIYIILERKQGKKESVS